VRSNARETGWCGNPRFLGLRGHYGFHATTRTPETPREKGAVEAGVRYLKSGFRPARCFGDLGELDEQYVGWRDSVCNVRIHASGRSPVGERLAPKSGRRCDRCRRPAGLELRTVRLNRRSKHRWCSFRCPKLAHYSAPLDT
jgi:hypothetical protein